MNRGEIGRREFGRATAGKGPVATGRVREASPVLAAGVEEFIFADVFSRSGLGARERELLTVAVLAAIGGADNQLGVHVPAALECGADPEELIQLCEQITPYAGFPRALNALRAVRAVLEERGLPLPVAVTEVALVDHATLAAEVGEGETGTLLIHAPELDRRMWRDVMRALPAGHHAVAPDLRGAGAAVGAPAPTAVGDLVADLVGVLDACGLRSRRGRRARHQCGTGDRAGRGRAVARRRGHARRAAAGRRRDRPGDRGSGGVAAAGHARGRPLGRALCARPPRPPRSRGLAGHDDRAGTGATGARHTAGAR